MLLLRTPCHARHSVVYALGRAITIARPAPPDAYGSIRLCSATRLSSMSAIHTSITRCFRTQNVGVGACLHVNLHRLRSEQVNPLCIPGDYL